MSNDVVDFPENQCGRRDSNPIQLPGPWADSASTCETT
jgi:hypothetical protein